VCYIRVLGPQPVLEAQKDSVGPLLAGSQESKQRKRNREAIMIQIGFPGNILSQMLLDS
jgi:hypothetical protein